MALDKMEFHLLQLKLFERDVNKKEVIEACRRKLDSGEIKDWQMKNLLATIPAEEFPNFDLRVDTPSVRALLFKELSKSTGIMGPAFWSGCPEASSRDFMALVADVTKIINGDGNDTIENRVITTLSRFAITAETRYSSKMRNVVNIADAFLNLPISLGETTAVMRLRNQIVEAQSMEVKTITASDHDEKKDSEDLHHHL